MKKEQEQEDKESFITKKTCLVIMPVSDCEPYETGHFKLVYEYIVKPACMRAGFIPQRVDDIHKTNRIVIDKLKQIVSADIAICDLSSRNSEVLYQLGIRQGFDLPTILIKDSMTRRIFDIRGFQDIEYDENLRIDHVNKTVDEIAEALLNISESKDSESPSISSLLGIRKAEIKQRVELSTEANILLEAISGVKDQLLKNNPAQPAEPSPTTPAEEPEAEAKKKNELSWVDSEGNKFHVGDVVTHAKYGLGILVDIIPEGLLRVKFNTIGMKVLRGDVEKLVLL